MTPPNRGNVKFVTWSWSGEGHSADFGALGRSEPCATLRNGLDELFHAVPAVEGDQLDYDIEHWATGHFYRVTGQRAEDGWLGVAVMLRDQEAQFRSHLLTVERLVRGATWRTDKASGERWLSPNLFRLFGVELAGDPMALFQKEILPKIAEEDRGRLVAFVAAIGSMDEKEFSFRADVNGERREFQVELLVDGSAYVGIALDVTEIRAAERSRMQAGELLREVARSVPAGIYVQQSDGTPDFGNDYLLDIFGVEHHDDIDWAGSIHPDDFELVARRWEGWLNGENTASNFFRIYNSDGEIRYLETNVKKIDSTEGTKLVSAVIDQTERVRQRELVMDSQRQLDWSERISRTGSWRSDLQDNITWSAGLYEILGKSPETFEVTPETFSDLIHPDFRDETDHIIERLLENGTSWDYELALQPEEGQMLWVRSTGELLRDSRGRPKEIRGVIQDVTPMRELEARVRRAEKMRALGELAGGVAHDFNNQLASILGNAQLIREEVDGDVREDCDAIITTARRCGELTNQLLAFSRRRPLESDSVRVQETVEDVLKLLKHAIDRDVEVKLSVSSDHLSARGDQAMIENAILNIALNSVQAMPDGGELHIDVCESQLEAATWEPDFEVTDGPAVEITIRDNGVGIREEDLRRVLDPFFTTRRESGGTGLGLATTYGTVRNHGGALAVESKHGVGTTVRVLLPMAEASDLSEPSEPMVIRHHFDGYEVLLVDDEPEVRRVLRRYLEHLGFAVVSAAGNQEASKIIGARLAARRPFDAAVIDLSMPDGPGTKTADLVNELWPSAHVLIISGYDVETALEDHPALPVLQKPFTMESLGSALEPVSVTKLAT